MSGDRPTSVVHLSIGLRRFDPKGGLSREDEKMLVSAHQHIRSAGIGQVEKRLVLAIPVSDRTRRSSLDDFTRNQLVGF